VHQAKYTKDIVRKFKMEDSKAMTTPMSTTIALDVDEEGEHVDQKEYRSMIGSLLYLTATRPDIQFSECLCAFSSTCVTLPTSTFGTMRLLLWRFMVFRTRNLPGVGWIGSPLLGLASFRDILWCLGLAANNQVLLNPLPRQSTLSQLVVALSSFGSHIP
jgi:hypothetical protein